MVETNFEKLVKNCVAQADLYIDSLTPQSAIIHGNFLTGKIDLNIHIHGEIVAFYCPLHHQLVFKNEEEIPHDVSSTLMIRSSSTEVGTWIIGKGSNIYYYLFYYHFPFAMVDEQTFLTIVLNMFKEVNFVRKAITGVDS